MTVKDWETFKERRAAEYRRDDEIKFLLRDALAALEILGVGAALWFVLAVVYA